MRTVIKWFTRKFDRRFHVYNISHPVFTGELRYTQTVAEVSYQYFIERAKFYVAVDWVFLLLSIFLLFSALHSFIFNHQLSFIIFSMATLSCTTVLKKIANDSMVSRYMVLANEVDNIIRSLTGVKNIEEIRLLHTTVLGLFSKEYKHRPILHQRLFNKHHYRVYRRPSSTDREFSFWMIKLDQFANFSVPPIYHQL